MIWLPMFVPVLIVGSFGINAPVEITEGHGVSGISRNTGG